MLDSGVDPRFDSNVQRPSLAQTFEDLATGALFTPVINRLESKGSSTGKAGDADAGDGQGLSNATRTLVAQALVDWLASGGTPLLGQFSYDDAVSSPGLFDGETLYALTAFSLDFGGQSYGLADLLYGDAVHRDGGFVGLDAAVAGVFSLLPAVAHEASSFAYVLPGGLTAPQSGFGSVSYERITHDVPEPAVLTLLLAALAPLAWARRRQRR